ncbi:MAG: hypothetical protein ACE5GV_14020 [Candidatus Scalindua sp.]
MESKHLANQMKTMPTQLHGCGYKIAQFIRITKKVKQKPFILPA